MNGAHDIAKVVIGNENLLEIRPMGVGPVGMVLCKEHNYVRRELLLRYGVYTVVCYRCVMFGLDLGSVFRVKSPGERCLPKA